MLMGPSDRAATAHTFVSWSTTTIVRIARTTDHPRMRTTSRLRVTSPAALATGFALHTLLRPRNHLEARNRNPVAAREAQAVRPFVHARERALDVVDGLACTRRQCEVALTLDADGVAFARLLVELGVALLALARENFGFGLELLGLPAVPIAFLDQPFLELGERARCVRRRKLLRRRLGGRL